MKISAFKDRSLAIVIPIANERDSAIEFIHKVIEQVADFKQLAVLTIFDRVCTDGTIDLVRELAKTEPRLKVIWSPENRSVVDAYMRGYREAIAGGADLILEMDAGFSHLPEDISKFLNAMDDGYDCAFGSRFCPGGKIVRPILRRYMTSKGGTLLTNFLIGTRLYDMTSGFQIFRREVLAAILANGIRSRGPFFQTEMKIYARKMKVREIPISYRMTRSAARRESIKDALKVLFALFFDRVRGKLVFAVI